MGAGEPQGFHFSLVRGGPFYRWMERSGLAKGDRRDVLRQSVAILLVCWVPFVVLWGIDQLLDTGATIPAGGFGAHIRFLVAIPVFFVAENSLHMRTDRCVDRFIGDDWAVGQRETAIAIVQSIAALRDKTLPEGLLLGLAFVASQSVLWGLAGPVGALGIDWTLTRSLATVWYVLVALPIFQFLTFRWLWRWFLWSLLLYRLSRLRIRPIPIHPDAQGGLEFLSESSVGFAYVLFGCSSVLAGTWGTRIVRGSQEATDFAPHALLLAVSAVVVAFGPLLVFAPTLWRTRFEALRSYGNLASEYTTLFHRKWILKIGAGHLLGTSDIQSLADLANSWHVLERMKTLPFTRRAVVIVVAATLAPLSLLLLTEFSVVDLLEEVGKTWLGLAEG